MSGWRRNFVPMQDAKTGVKLCNCFRHAATGQNSIAIKAENMTARSIIIFITQQIGKKILLTACFSLGIALINIPDVAFVFFQLIDVVDRLLFGELSVFGDHIM